MERKTVELKPGTSLDNLASENVLSIGNIKYLIIEVTNFSIEALGAFKMENGEYTARRRLFFKKDYNRTKGRFERVYERPDWVVDTPEYKEDMRQLQEAGLWGEQREVVKQEA